MVQLTPDKIISAIVSVVTYIALEMCENPITDWFIQTIYGQGEIASQYYPLAGALINCIPAVFIGCATYASLNEKFRSIISQFK